MADGQDDDEERTEEPSQRRLDEARKEGQVPMSRDVAGAATLLSALAALWIAAGPLSRAAIDLVRRGASPGGASAGELLDAGLPLLGLGALVLATIWLVAVVASGAQTGFGFWPQLLAPKPDRLFSISRLVHAFTKDGVVDLVFAAVKATALGGVGMLVLERFIESTRFPQGLAAPPVGVIGSGLVRLGMIAAAIAVLDMLLQRHRHTKRLRMRKDELRREMKEDEGDPQIKGRRRRKHRDLLKGRIEVEVPRADALVVNPTHISVAVRYRRKSDRAPRVIAKGKGKQAEKMRELAVANGVPIVQNIPLARFLVRKVRVGHEVPAEVYQAVAGVLAFVFKATGRVPGTGAD